jgi:hypothetical protein
MSKVVSITTKDNGNETTVHVLGNGRIPDYMAKTLDSPTRIVVDILNADKPFESMTIPTTSANLKNVRVGYHPERIRLVLELREARVPIIVRT